MASHFVASPWQGSFSSHLKDRFATHGDMATRPHWCLMNLQRNSERQKNSASKPDQAISIYFNLFHISFTGQGSMHALHRRYVDFLAFLPFRIHFPNFAPYPSCALWSPRSMWLESVKKDLLSPYLYRGQVVQKCSDLSFKSSESIQFCKSNAKEMHTCQMAPQCTVCDAARSLSCFYAVGVLYISLKAA